MFSGSPIKENLETWCNCKIDNYAITGSSLEDGWVSSIPSQYNDIKKLNPKTIIMDGGGNDIFSNKNKCLTLGDDCKLLVNKIVDIAKSLLNEIGNNGVHNIIYLGFYYLQNLNEVIDYGTEKLSDVCNKLNNTNCYFSDPRNITMPLSWDGVHPTNEGFKLLANNIWNTIQDNDIMLN
jgi:lysophospholipase L1-like esterase